MLAETHKGSARLPYAMARPRWVIQETMDLELLLRIAAGTKHAIDVQHGSLTPEQYGCVLRLRQYGLISTGVRLDGREVVETYALTRKGKRAYSNTLDGFEKLLPAPEDR